MEKPSGKDLVDTYIQQFEMFLNNHKNNLTDEGLIDRIKGVVQEILEAKTKNEIGEKDCQQGINLIKECLINKGIQQEKIGNIFQNVLYSTKPLIEIAPKTADKEKVWNQETIVKELWKADPQQVNPETISQEIVAKVQKAHEYLSAKGFVLRGVWSDGDCFFYAFLESYKTLERKIPLLESANNKITFLRLQISEQYKNHLKGTDTKPNEKTVRANQIAKGKNWVTFDDEGSLLSKALDIPIRVLTLNSEEDKTTKEIKCGSIDTLTFQQDQPSKELQTVQWDSAPENQKSKDYIFIVDLGGHFVYAERPLKSFETATYSNKENNDNPLDIRNNKEKHVQTTEESMGKMVSEFFDWPTISHLNRDLFLLEKEMHSNKKNVEEIFKEIKKLTDFDSVDINTLNRLERIFTSYFSILSKLPENKLFKHSPYFKEVKAFKKKISDSREQLINIQKKFIKEKLIKLKKLKGSALKNDLRNFIMDMCQGKCIYNGKRIPPCSINQLFQAILSTKNLDNKIKNLLNTPNLFSSYEWKTGIINFPKKSIYNCVNQNLKKTIKSNNTVIDIMLDELKNQRLFALNNLEFIYEKTQEKPLEQVNSKFFPKTNAWYIGSTMDSEDAAFEFDLQEIGQKYGISLITDSVYLSSEKENLIIFSDSRQAPFTQDFVDFSQDEVRIPVFVDKETAIKIREEAKSKRLKRDTLWNLSKIGTQLISRPSERLALVGALFEDELQKKAIGLALAMGATPIMNLTYSEGGNTLIGTKDDGSMYIIVGKDSYVISKIILERDLGREMDDAEIKKAFAIDYGVSSDSIYFIEQPGDFHLDMNMAIIGSNTIAVNDSSKIDEVFSEEIQEWNKQIDEKALNFFKLRRQIRLGLKKKFEDKSAQDLSRYGFKVVRLAGRLEFEGFSPIPKINFFNMLTATAPNGTKIVIGMGVMDNEKHKGRFKDMFEKNNGIQFYFLDQKKTDQSLIKNGGISCRTKTLQ